MTSRSDGSSLQRVEIVEIGDMRQTRHGDGDRAVAVGAAAVQRDRIFRGQAAGVAEIGDQAQGRPAGAARRSRSMPA